MIEENEKIENKEYIIKEERELFEKNVVNFQFFFQN